ncbi:hypothetical protein GCM10011375_31170 [Hymenobacter qilianensis]|uniref:Uncharacterized protein n=1 Tax=Hymenobacter qilianensis TaxID=1385715 RepID=A0ACB5PUR0_9BACT|nr:hypothetical protein GCM10011375_31170 [Hymenobacter qilianensis]
MREIKFNQHLKYIKGLAILLFMAAMYCGLATLDVMVSLKYETNSMEDCISSITGYNLCFMLKVYPIAGVSCCLLAMGLVAWRQALKR